MTTRSITIIGGGVAGLSLGIALARRRVPVAVHERTGYPRHRVCGEFVAGVDPAVLEGLGIADILESGPTLRSMSWSINGGPARAADLPQPVRGLSRYRLDQALAERLIDLGGRLETRSSPQPCHADGTVLATGRPSRKSPWLGLKLHCEDLVTATDLEMHVGDDAYVGLARVENQRVNVCGLFRRRDLAGHGPQLLDQYLRANRLITLADRVHHGQPDPGSWKTTAGFGFGWSSFAQAADRCCLGDQAAMIPPFTGNGISMAFESAFDAVEPLTGYATGATDWITACQRVRQSHRDRFGGRLRTARLLHPLLFYRPTQRLGSWLLQRGWIPFETLYHLTRN